MNHCTTILIVMLILATVGGSGWEAQADQNRASLELGPLLGHTAANEARIWIKASAPATSGIIIGETAQMQHGRLVRGPRLTSTTDYMGVVLVTGLRPATRYHYKVAGNQPRRDRHRCVPVEATGPASHVSAAPGTTLERPGADWSRWLLAGITARRFDF